MNVKIHGLVLEGGAMRGMYTAGVLDTFMSWNLEAEKIVGVSAGALFGVNYLSDQRGRAIRYNKRFNSDKNYLGLLPLIKEGNIVSTDYAYKRVPHELDPFDDEKYKSSKSKFYAVVTNMKTGEAEYIKIKSVFEQMDILRASGSMPLVSKPVCIGGSLYLDGAIADSIPFEWMAGKIDSANPKLIVVLTRDMSYRKKPMLSVFSDYYKKKYPEFADKVKNRHNLYNQQTTTLRNWEADGRAMVIRPSEPINIGRIEKNPDKLQEVYNLGVKDASNQRYRIMNYLSK